MKVKSSAASSPKPTLTVTCGVASRTSCSDDPNDAITFTQRICGVCPVPHGLTATHAADAVMGWNKSHITFEKDAADTDAANPGGYGIPPQRCTSATWCLVLRP